MAHSAGINRQNRSSRQVGLTFLSRVGVGFDSRGTGETSKRLNAALSRSGPPTTYKTGVTNLWQKNLVTSLAT